MINPEKFYSTSDMLPPRNVKVEVLWHPVRWDFFHAALVTDPKTKRSKWLTHEYGDPIFLPVDQKRQPANPWTGWHTLQGDHPEYWRPINPNLWELPLPKPFLLNAPPEENRMYSATQSFHAVDDAEAANIAAEMEAMRSEYKDQKPDGSSRHQWWRDPSRVRYLPVGRISRNDAYARTMRAVASDDVWSLAPSQRADAGLRGMVSDDVLRVMADHENNQPASNPIVKFRSLTQDENDYDLAMTWFARLEMQHRSVLFLLASPIQITFADMAHVIKRKSGKGTVSPTRVSDIFRDAIEDLFVLANGGHSVQSRRLDADLEKIRFVNREARS